jgi:hypothetical protein
MNSKWGGGRVLEKPTSEIKPVIPVSKSINQFKSVFFSLLAIIPQRGYGVPVTIHMQCSYELYSTHRLGCGYASHSIHLPNNQIRKQRQSYGEHYYFSHPWILNSMDSVNFLAMFANFSAVILQEISCIVASCCTRFY